MAFRMTSTIARQWAQAAERSGNHAMAEAWAKRAAELATEEAQASWGQRKDLA